MAAHSSEESEIQELASHAATSSSTNPWGPTTHKLSEQVGGLECRVIGIQDSTVIDCAIGSPGMLKPLAVHGFIVCEPKPKRKPAELTDVVEKLSRQIRIAPYISTAVVFPFQNGYFPSHVLSSSPAVGGLLGAKYPNAARELAIAKEVGDTESSGMKGPWRVVPAKVIVAETGQVIASLSDPEDEARFLAPGDAVLLTDPSDASRSIGLGRVHHVRPSTDGNLLVVFDRYAAVVRPTEGDRPAARKSEGN